MYINKPRTHKPGHATSGADVHMVTPDRGKNKHKGATECKAYENGLVTKVTNEKYRNIYVTQKCN